MQLLITYLASASIKSRRTAAVKPIDSVVVNSVVRTGIAGTLIYICQRKSLMIKGTSKRKNPNISKCGCTHRAPTWVFPLLKYFEKALPSILRMLFMSSYIYVKVRDARARADT